MVAPSRRLLRAFFGALVPVVTLATTVSSASASRTATSAARITRTAVRDSRTVLAPTHTALAGDARALYSSTPTTLGGTLLAYPPAPSAAERPTAFVYLHGAHGLAERGCPTFRAGASDHGWLVCPEALERDAVGHFSWGADLRAQARVVDHALSAVPSTALPVVVGFSQGSFVFLDLAKTHRVRARAAILLGADIHPVVADLRAAGVTRVVLGSGAKDAPYRSLKAEVARLEAEGMPARFVDLGGVGHTYATEHPAALREAMGWAAGG